MNFHANIQILVSYLSLHVSPSPTPVALPLKYLMETNIKNKYLLERGYLLSLHGGLGSFPIPLYKKEERYCSAKKWVHVDSQEFFIYSFIHRY